MPIHQGIYRQNFSIDTASLLFTDNNLNNTKSKCCTAMTCLDLSAAFDTVNQNNLLDILKTATLSLQLEKIIPHRETIQCNNRKLIIRPTDH